MAPARGPRRAAAGLGLLLAPAAAIDNGLGLRPPMGWRSWNLFGFNVSQSLVTGIMDAMVERRREVDGAPTSLCDLGFCDVGLDDAWQACGSGNAGLHYHLVEADGTARPVVDTGRFPDMRHMTDHAHRLGLTAGWYGNNCLCMEAEEVSAAVYAGDVLAAVGYGFDGIKLDNCGSQLDLELWAKLFNESGKPMMIENCHWGQTVPAGDHCPWNLFRTSGDIRASYGSMVGNLLTTVHWAKTGYSRPGCWAYPDMLEVGCAHGPGGDADPGLSLTEMRSHFGSWCIVSSPLVLSHDLRNETLAELVWPIISNREAIAVNQAWAGHSGSPFKESEAKVALDDFNMEIRGQVVPHVGDVPSWQQFYKPLGSGRVAVLLMNHDGREQALALDFADVPGLSCSRCDVRDIWERKDLGAFDARLKVTVASHDSAFYVLSPGSGEATLVV